MLALLLSRREVQAAEVDSPFNAIANGGQAGFSESSGSDFLLSGPRVIQAMKIDQPCEAIASIGQAGFSDGEVGRVPPTMVRGRYMVAWAEVREVPNRPQYSQLLAGVVP